MSELHHSKMTAKFALILLLLGLSASLTAHAGLGDFVKSAVSTTVHVVTAPTETVVKAVQAVANNKPIGTVLDPAKNLGKVAGDTVAQGTTLAAAPQEEIYKRAQKEMAKIGGPAAFVFDVSTFAERNQEELVKTSGLVTANILQQQNPLQIVAIPLSAAIREGRERYDPIAKPIPDDVKAGLAGFYAPGTLERARYAVGKLEITLPNGLGAAHKFGDSGYAVTVDDIIVFNVAPPSFKDDPGWWGHEVTHVEQYMQLGIEEFSRRYVFSAGADLENPAIHRGAQVQAKTNINGTATVALSAMTSGAVASHPLYPVSYAKAQAEHPTAQPMSPPLDPAIAQCVFPGDPRPVNYLITKSGRIVVVDRFNGQWLQIGWALPPSIPNVAWHYQAGGVFYDVFPNGQIWLRFTPMGPQQVGFVISL
jgi:hypothetical protein